MHHHHRPVGSTSGPRRNPHLLHTLWHRLRLLLPAQGDRTLALQWAQLHPLLFFKMEKNISFISISLAMFTLQKSRN